MIKRIFDIVASALGLLVLAPMFMFIALTIAFDSRGPVFYRQERVGRYFAMFKLWKFRTMYVGADRHSAITIGKRDARITRVGYWLRKFKIDELPQLINVLLGEMSLVGPRPEVKKFVDSYSPEQRKVLSILPGLTDWASIHYRHENSLLEGKEDPIHYYEEVLMPAKLALNLKYLEQRSFWVDLKILFQTLVALFRKE
jgi:lipopolysaccharide/colanic/teichoic acid biosynthesis glycosyltransferase